MTDKKDSAGRAGRPSGRAFLARFLPAFIILGTFAVIAWSAWPVLRPVRQIEVAQAVFDRSTASESTQPDTSTQVQTGPTVQAAGWLEAEPFHTACTALVDGVLEEINVLEGDWIEKGQVVARLVQEDEQLGLDAANAQVLSAKAQLADARADLKSAQANWDEPVELLRSIESSQANLNETKAELAQLPSLIAGVEALLSRLEAERDWLERSESGGAATELELLVSTKNADAKRSELEALRARQQILEARIARYEADLKAAERTYELRIADQQQLERAKALVSSAEAALAYAEVRQAEAALALERTTIRSPISGYVLRRLKSPGDKVVRMMDDMHSAHIVHIYDPSKLQVRVDVPLADASHIRVGQPCEIVVEILPDRTFKGEVLRITHEADLQKNTLEIKVKVIDPDPVLKPEMLTRVKFLGGNTKAEQSSRNTGKPSPTTSVLVRQDTLDQDRVWMVRDRSGMRGVLQAVNVERVSEDAEWVRVRGNIQPGALLAVVQEGYRDGLTIAIRKPDQEKES